MLGYFTSFFVKKYYIMLFYASDFAYRHADERLVQFFRLLFCRKVKNTEPPKTLFGINSGVIDMFMKNMTNMNRKMDNKNIKVPNPSLSKYNKEEGSLQQELTQELHKHLNNTPEKPNHSLNSSSNSVSKKHMISRASMKKVSRDLLDD